MDVGFALDDGVEADGELGPGAGGALEHAASVATATRRAALPRIGAAASRLAPQVARVMWVILLEALAALVLLGFIVWWTMFSGRSRGERRDARERSDDDG